ncbi:hypothetical protein SAMN02799624_05379 [Paenibacillus sp. UNC496MF]|uniref:hypothetical protein n=1 Tax=Paenibacillus sp. UNC496MF TaxID=1502753 RepID=UPI0008E287A9|nr:hypothetical protein [Paenibacillus sp. UNC496MF]SFJ65075.1 hypothetical protein SAMN02799624_05379 [Paenibacillus sp. UNC496MF]
MDTITNPEIIAVVCTTPGPEVHITDVNPVLLDKVVQNDYWVEVGNVVFPFDWYDSMELCDETTLKRVKREYKL